MRPDGWPERRERWQQFSHITLQQLIEWSWGAEIAYEDVQLTQVHIKYVTTESDDERAQREASETERQRRQEKWERETLARLRAKYEESP
jgi:hypothetical protein